MKAIEKIRQEIEWRKKLLFPHKNKGIILCKEMTKEYDSLLSFLDTLESEKPMEQEGLDKKAPRYPLSVVADLLGSTPQPPVIIQQKSEKPIQEGLEEEVRRYYFDVATYISRDNPPLSILSEIARHFAKWGAEHAKIDVTDFCKPIDPGIAQCIADHSLEMLGEDEKPFLKDLEEAAKKYATEWHENPDGSAWKPFFEASAIKAYIAGAKWQKEQMMKEAVEGTLASTTVGYPAIFLDEMKSGLHLGDKVKLIICKEDEE